MITRKPFILLALSLGLGLTSWPAHAQPITTETDCANGVDDDGDGLVDCADSDCYNQPICQSSGGLENTDKLCSDFIDNDGDGAIDCDDMDCNTATVEVCKGSWRGPLDGSGVAPKAVASQGPNAAPNTSLPALGEGMTVEDLLGMGNDADGERNNVVCSDGIDNDGDGLIDCADFGCRFDPTVTVCQTTPGLRFSMIASVMTKVDFEAPKDQTAWDTRFNRLQLRVFGPLPYIQNSFFYIGFRADRTPRFTFSFFTMPIYGEHFININSGGGGLSNGQVLSSHKNLLIDVPYFLYNAFEQGNGAALEFSGPLAWDGRLRYRVFGAGGSGRADGNIGGRYYKGEHRNYTWGVGGQVSVDLAGHFDRWDTRMLYTPTPMAATAYIGARYDERDAERFTAGNFNLVMRYNRFVLNAEGYLKREFNFGAWQWTYNVQLGVLVVPKLLLVAADVGQFYATEFDELPTNVGSSALKRPNDEFEWRAAAHLYLWRTTGVLSVLYSDRTTENQKPDQKDLHRRELRAQFTYRF